MSNVNIFDLLLHMPVFQIIAQSHFTSDKENGIILKIEYNKNVPGQTTKMKEEYLVNTTIEYVNSSIKAMKIEFSQVDDLQKKQKLLSVKEAAKELNVSDKTVYRWIKRKQITPVVINRRNKILAEDVNTLRKESKNEGKHDEYE